jgi:SAM-dependent methyltransferase
MGATTMPMTDYVMGTTAEERRRLIDQALTIDRATERYLREAGIEEGMRVLDLGSGMGDTALLAARLVGPSGRVLGIERSQTMIAAATARMRSLDAPQVEIVAGDVTELPRLGGRPFDAVIGRLILIHLPDPVAVLRDAIALVRPGGLAVMIDYDLGAITSHPPAPLWERTIDRLLDAMTVAGGHLRMGLDLRPTFLAAGLPAPRLRSDQDLGGGPDWAGYERVAEVARSVRPTLRAYDEEAAAELDVDTLAARLRDDVVATGGVATWPSLVGAWARVPD